MDGVHREPTFTNRGTGSCAVYGYPGVPFLTAGRAAITAPHPATGTRSGWRPAWPPTGR